MTVRRIATPIGPALAQAATDLAAAPPGTAEEWILPAGDHALAAAIAIDVTGRSVTLRGEGACNLVFAAGGLSVHGAVVELDSLAFDAAATAAALRVDADAIAVSAIQAAASGAAALAAIDLAATGAIDIEDVTVSRAKGSNVVGVRALGGSVRATGVVVQNVDGTNATAIRIGSLGDADAVELSIEDVTATAAGVGAMIAARGRIEVARVIASDLAGSDVTGIAVVGFGAGTGSLSVVDVEAARLTATVRATGVLAGGRRDVVVRGFTVANVTGPAATGLVVVGGGAPGSDAAPEVEVGFGQVDRIVGSAGDAAGVRVIAMPSPRTIVIRDVAVAEVAGAPVPTTAIPPRDADGEAAWQSWGADFLADLDDDAVPRETLPVLFGATDVVGLAVTAVVDEVEPFLDDIEAGDLAVIDSSVRVVAGSAIQIESELRPVWLRRIEVTTAVLAGYLQSDQMIIANATWDRLGAALVLGPGVFMPYDAIFSRIASATGPLAIDPDADWLDAPQHAVYADVASDRFAPLGALPYVAPGPAALPPALLAGTLPPPETIDLRLVAGSPLHETAVAPPPDDLELTDDDRLFVGAFPPDVPAICDLYDPERPAVGAVASPPPPDPVVDYRARDAKALLAVMLARAQQVMPPWTDRGPADLTTMLFETVAERLDQLAYQQERAVAEGFLDDARLRRSVEDHVRPLDYEVDPGLSATTMLRFTFDRLAVAEVRASREERAKPGPNDTEEQKAHKLFLQSTLAALDELALDGVLEVPAGTLAANRRNDDRVIVFATEEPLAYFPSFDQIRIIDDIPQNATSAILQGTDEHDRKLTNLARNRWLVFWRGPGQGGHVVRVTTVRRGTDTVEIGWDPRRPLPWPLAKTGSGGFPVVLGNVVPAHHGFPLASVPPENGVDLQRYSELLKVTVEGGRAVEVPVPFQPISIQALGYPLPRAEQRRGHPAIRVLVEDDEWRRIDDLSIAGPGDEVFALRIAADGRPALRFGDGVSGAALPARGNTLRFDIAVGAGREGNVNEHILTRLLAVPVDATRGPNTGWLFREDMETLRAMLAVDNPVPAVGGRDREPIDRIRYRAPLLASRPRSAVTPDDYERVVRELPEVAGAHAQVIRGPVRPAVRVTVLLRDEDTLDPDERLRRWAMVRSVLERARLLGFDVESVPPIWAPLDLDVIVDADPHAEAGTVRDAVIAALSGNGGLLDPDTTGLGGDVQLADVYRAVLAAHGVAAARVRRFRRLRPHAPERLHAGFIAIKADEVAVVRGPARPAADGVLTVTVCGGLR